MESLLFRYKARVIVISVVIFIASLVKSCDEARYAMFGETVAASRVTTTTTRDSFLIDYEYLDGGTKRKGHDRLSSPPPATLMIQYIPGKTDESRMSGHVEWGWFILPTVCLAFIGYQTWKFWQFYKS